MASVVREMAQPQVMYSGAATPTRGSSVVASAATPITSMPSVATGGAIYAQPNGYAQPMATYAQPNAYAAQSVRGLPSVAYAAQAMTQPMAYAQPTASYAAPMASYAQPMGSMANVGMVMQAPSTQVSYVPPPTNQLLDPQNLPQVQGIEPTLPPSLTQGIPDPSAIDRQRVTYAKTLDDQLTHGTDVLNMQLKQQADNLRQVGEQQKKQYGLQIDQQIMNKEMELAAQHNQQLLLLQQATQQQKTALEQQANALLLEYNQKKSQEDMLCQQYQFQKQQYEAQMRYNQDMTSLQQQQAAAAQQVAVQQAQIAEHAQRSVAINADATMKHRAAAAAAINASTQSFAPQPMTTYGAPPTAYMPYANGEVYPAIETMQAVPNGGMAGQIVQMPMGSMANLGGVQREMMAMPTQPGGYGITY